MKAKKFIQDNASWAVLLVLLAMFSILSPNFRTFNNAITILRQVSVNGIAAVGLSIILISGGIDLSTGSQAAVSGMICSLLVVKAGWGTVPAIVVAVVLNAVVFGILNGLAIAYTDMPPLIATLGTMNIARGVAFLINNGFTVYGLPESAKFLGQASVGPIPVCVLLLLIILIIGSFILNKTTYGRLIFSVGANNEAARLSGIPVKQIMISAYFVGSIFISLAGIVLMSRLNSGMPSAGSDIYIDILAGCIIGGISSKGGEGNIVRMVSGILIMGIISNGMNVVGISEYWQYVAKGGILIASVGIDSYRSKKSLDRKSHMIRSSAATSTAVKR
ncbi:MAG: ABC transporter permease [Oscillospiraceae bacterium]